MNVRPDKEVEKSDKKSIKHESAHSLPIDEINDNGSQKEQETNLNNKPVEITKQPQDDNKKKDITDNVSQNHEENDNVNIADEHHELSPNEKLSEENDTLKEGNIKHDDELPRLSLTFSR